MADGFGVSLVCLGEALIDLVAEDAGVPLAAAERFVRAAGGAPANVAVGAARLGVRSGFVGKVGADPFGDHIVATLQGGGVDTSRVRRDEKARTGLAFVSLGEHGERDFLFYRHPSADQRLSVADLDDDYLRAARVLHFGSLSLAGGPVREATLHAVRVAGEAGALRSFDANLRLDAFRSPAAARRAALTAVASAEVVKVSEDELAFLADGQGEAAARKLVHDALALLVVTHGPRGASYYLGPRRALVGEPSQVSARGHVPGFPVKPIDTTGAGDAFVAGLLTGLLAAPGSIADPAAIAHIVRMANACGAIATTRLGAIPALPTREQVEAFLAVHGAGGARG